jgi:hypothetical protein
MKPLADITHDAIRVLCREIGVANTMRFVGQFTAGYGNYTEDREQLFVGMTLDDIVSEIKQRNAVRPGDGAKSE